MSDWYPGEYESPDYPGIPMLAVVDSIKPALPLLKRRKWTTLRNNALEKWIESGLQFVVSVQPLTNPSYPWNAGSITLSIGNPVSSYDSGAVGGYVESQHAGYCVFAIEVLKFREDQRAATCANVAHEVGHALGFGHGGHGIMAGNHSASAEEITALQNYYWLGG